MNNSARAMMTMRKATHGFLTSRELRYKNNSRFDAKQVLIVETADSDDKDKWNSQVKQKKMILYMAFKSGLTSWP